MNNEWLARLKEKIGKKENKEELPVRKKLLLLFLTGLLLLVIVLPFPKKSDSEDAETGTETTTENRGSYERYLEQKTEEALQCVEGVGNVKVMITLKSSEENVVEKDQQSDGQSVEEEDSQGGKSCRLFQFQTAFLYNSDSRLPQSSPPVLQSSPDSFLIPASLCSSFYSVPATLRFITFILCASTPYNA